MRFIPFENKEIIKKFTKKKFYYIIKKIVNAFVQKIIIEMK